MWLFEGLGDNFGGMFSVLWWLFTHGGWAVVLYVVVYILFKMYHNEVIGQWVGSQEWVFLNIKVPRENTVSTLAVESVFAQMHALHSSITFAQNYVEGKIQLWYSLEIVSFGGKISFIIRVPKKQRDLVEAAFYAQYPNAEIVQVSDYMENINYDPEESEFDLWGTEWKLIEDDVIPIRTYRDFEHPTAEEKIIDPLSPLFEALSKIQPHEFYGIQILIQPISDPDWKPRGESKIKQLIGEKEEKKTGFIDLLMAPINAVADFSFRDAILPSGGGGDEGKQKNNWQFMTEAQKERVTLVERKIGKPGYLTKIRHLYVAPRNRMDGSKKSVVIGAIRPLGSAMTNQFKPDTKKTWTAMEYKISPTLEQPYLDSVMKERKKRVFQAFKDRDIGIGISQFIMNTEELATLFHFPISETGVSAPIETTESKKASPPVNLPVMDI